MKLSLSLTAFAALLFAALVASAQGSAPAAAPGATPAAAPAPGTQPVSQFTLDEIGERAEDVATQLRSMIEAISDQDAFAQLEERVFHFSHRISDRWRETDQLLAGSLRRGPLETLASSWRALRTELLQIREIVDSHLDRREADLASIDRMKETWNWTLEHANSLGVPPPVLGRVQQTLAAIDATRVQVDARSARLLVLQDAVSRAMQACDDAASRIANARKQAVTRVFATHEPPLWESLEAFAPDDARPQRSWQRNDLGAGLDALTIYVQAYRSGCVVTVLLGLFFCWVLFRERDRTRRAVSSGVALPDFVTYAFRSPIATALLLALVVSRPLRPDPPAVLQHLVFVIGMPAALIVLRPVLDPRLLRAFVAFSAFFLIDLGRALLRLPAHLEQLVLFAEMAAAAGLTFWSASVIATAVGPLATRARSLQRGAQRMLVAVGVAMAFAALAALVGYLELSDFVGGGALAIVYLAIGVLAFRVAAAGAVWLALVESPLSRLRAIDRNRARTEAGLSRALDAVSVGIWIAFALQTFELLDPVVAFVGAALDAKLQAGELSLSVGRVLGFFAVVVIAWLTARIVIFVLEEDVYPRMRLARGVPYALSSIVRYGLLLAGFFAALATLGLDLTHLTVLVSAFGLGLGFGMQQIINNFVSGLILLFERPVQVGDLVQMNELNGQVLRIGIRSSTIRTPDGAEVIIPNSDLIQNDVTNWTLSDRRRRLTIEVGVAYGIPAERVIALLVEVASRDARVVTEPGPEALFVGFGASSLDFQLRFWTDEAKWWTLKSDVTVALQGALRDAGIDVPFTTITLLQAGRDPADPEAPR